MHSRLFLVVLVQKKKRKKELLVKFCEWLDTKHINVKFNREIMVNASLLHCKFHFGIHKYTDDPLKVNVYSTTSNCFLSHGARHRKGASVFQKDQAVDSHKITFFPIEGDL